MIKFKDVKITKVKIGGTISASDSDYGAYCNYYKVKLKHKPTGIKIEYKTDSDDEEEYIESIKAFEKLNNLVENLLKNKG
jgi:hypothetical protein